MRELLERETELSVLDGGLRGARSSRGSMILVEGPPGIGKTALLDCAADRAKNAGMRVGRGEGYELDREPLGAALAMLAPAGIEAATESGSSDEFAVVESLFSACARAADEHPMLLAIDDLQWVDSGTLALVRRLGREITELPICLLAGLRSGEPRSAPLRESFLAAEEAEVLTPAPLSPAATGSIVRERFGEEASESLIRSVAGSTGGNPYLLRELLGSLHEAGLGPESVSSQVATVTPESVTALASARLGRCSPEGRRLAVALAVLGRAGDVELAVAAAGLGRDTEGTLDELRGLDLLSEAGLAIRHPLLGRAIFETIDTAEARAARLRAARVLVDHGSPARAGAQLLAAGDRAVLGEDWALRSLLAAAAQSAARGDRSEAVGFLDRALEAHLLDTDRAAVLRERGRIKSMSRDPEALRDLDEALELCADPVERAEIALMLGRTRFNLVQLQEAAAGCRSAIADLAGSERELRLMLEAEALNADRLRGAERERPRELAGEVGSASTSGERAVLVHVAAEAAATGDSSGERVAELALRAWRSGDLIGEAGPDAALVSFLGTTLAWCEEFDPTLELVEAQLEAGRRRHAPVTISYALALRAGTRLRLGELAEAEADAEQVVTALPASDPLAQMISFGWLLEALVDRGRAAEAERRLATSGLVAELPDVGTTHYLMMSRGTTRQANGDPEAALADFLEAGERAERAGYQNPAGYAWRSRAALAELELGRPERGLELAAAEVERSRRFGTPRALGISLRALALCSEADARESLLTESVATLDRSRARLERARALRDLGMAQLERGEENGACATLERAMDEAHRCGAEPLVAAAMEGLRAAGKRPRRPAVRGVDALTAQQLRTAQLAASGRSNPEIAEALFLTRRTVELHLTGAYRKLEIDSREQLAGALADGDD